MVLVPLEDSSWLAGSCCPGAGVKGDDVDEATDDLRLPTRREDAGGRAGKDAVMGDWLARGWLGEGGFVLRGSWPEAVEMGVRRVL